MNIESLFGFSNMCIDKEKAYFVLDRFGILLSLKLKNFEIEKPLKNIKINSMPDKMIFSEEYVFFLSDDLWHYDIKRDTLDRLGLNKIQNEKKTEYSYFGKDDNGNRIIVSKYEGKVIVLSSTGTVKKILEEKMGEQIKKTIRCGEQLLFLPERGNEILEYDLNRGIKKRHQPIEERIVSIGGGGDYLILLSEDGSVFKWDYKNNGYLQELVKNVPEENSEICVTENTIFFLPDLDGDILCYKGNNLSIYKDYPTDFRSIGFNNWSRYTNVCENEEYYYYPMRRCNYVLTIDKREGIIKWEKIKFSDFEIKEIMDAVLDWSNGIINEKEFSLEDYTKYIAGL